MIKYRKKPVEIEAVQWNGRNAEEMKESTGYEPSEVEILEAFEDWLDEKYGDSHPHRRQFWGGFMEMAWLEAFKRGMRFNPTAKQSPTAEAPDAP